MCTVSLGSCAGGKSRKCGYPNGASGSKKNNLSKELFSCFPHPFYVKRWDRCFSYVISLNLFNHLIKYYKTIFLEEERGCEKLSNLPNIIPSVKGKYKI